TVHLDDGGALTVAPTEPSSTEHVAVAIRPQAIALHRTRPEGSPRNTWQATVAELEADRDRIRVSLAGRPAVTAEITTESVDTLGLVPGERVWVSVKATDVIV